MVDDDPEAALAEHSRALVEAIDANVVAWVVRAVASRAPGLEAEAIEAGRRARAEVVPRIRALLAEDVDEQAGTPLSLLRTAVRHPTEVLAAAGVPPVERDDFARQAFPDDVYDLTPASFRDVSPALEGPGVAWGAAKAFVHLRRRRG